MAKYIILHLGVGPQGERFIVTNAQPYPPFSVLEARHAEIRAAFGRADDEVEDPEPPEQLTAAQPTAGPKL